MGKIRAKDTHVRNILKTVYRILQPYTVYGIYPLTYIMLRAASCDELYQFFHIPRGHLTAATSVENKDVRRI